MFLQEDSVHDSLAITVANAVLSDPTDSAVRIFCKSLNQMELTASNKVISKGVTGEINKMPIVTHDLL